MRCKTLFDHLIGAGEQYRRDFEAERLCGLKVDHQLELGWLHDRQISGLLALQNAAGVNADLAIAVGQAGTIASEATGCGVLAARIDSGHRMMSCERNE